VLYFSTREQNKEHAHIYTEGIAGHDESVDHALRVINMEQRELGWRKRMEGEKGKIDLSQGLTLECPFTLLSHDATTDYRSVSI
jgi:hypothetical protein